jgi:hypothetical protein
MQNQQLNAKVAEVNNIAKGIENLESIIVDLKSSIQFAQSLSEEAMTEFKQNIEFKGDNFTSILVDGMENEMRITKDKIVKLENTLANLLQ